MDTDNISTIAVWVYMLISPLLVKYGIDIDQATFTAAFVAIVGLILAIWSSKNPNTFEFLGNKPEENTDEITINDVDPASEYDDQ